MQLPLGQDSGATTDLESASDIIDKIQGAIWSQEQKRALQSAVTSRIQAPAATSGLSRNVTQTLHHFQKYISHDLLQALQRKDLAVRGQLMRVAMMLVDLGCINPSEKTIQDCMATSSLIMMAENEVSALSPACKLNMSRDFKSMVKTCVKNRHDRNIPLLCIFPSSAEEWKSHAPEQYEKLFGTNRGVNIKLNDSLLAFLVRTWPCRACLV